MKCILVGLAFSALAISQSVHAKECFLLKEKSKVVKTEGQCDTAYSPNSTFKIALSLMGFDSGILVDENSPAFPLTKEFTANINVCKGDHNPKTWMRDSCVWYSQVLTKKMGSEKFRKYVTGFKYGNQDVSGDPGKNNGLTQSWLNSSIRITPDEQIQFVDKMINRQLPVSERAYEMTKKILFIQELAGGWNLYGKTGNGRDKSGLQHGWFTGWIEKGSRKLLFVMHIADENKQKVYASFRARNEALIKLWYAIDEIEK